MLTEESWERLDEAKSLTESLANVTIDGPITITAARVRRTDIDTSSQLPLVGSFSLCPKCFEMAAANRCKNLQFMDSQK